MLKRGWLAKQLKEEKRTPKDIGAVVRQLQELYIKESTNQAAVDKRPEGSATSSTTKRGLHPSKRK